MSFTSLLLGVAGKELASALFPQPPSALRFPTAGDDEVARAGREARRSARRQTILTSGAGVPEPPVIGQRTVLGQAQGGT